VSGRIAPLARYRRREQFARAVDASAAPPDGDDDLAVVALLRRSTELGAPDDAERRRIRQRVLTALAEPEPTRSRSHRCRSHGSGRLGSRHVVSGARGRLAVAMVAALCVVLSLGGMSVLLSRDALPGDALYGVKRSAESASLGLTFGDQSKGLKHLELAAARLSEIETLADRYRDTGGGPTGSYLSALADFDADATAGARQLTALGTNHDGHALDALHDWASAQASRLDQVREALPDALRSRAAGSRDLSARIAQRAADLRGRLGCYSITSGGADDLGQLPAQGECGTPGTDPSAPNASARALTSTPAAPAAHPTTAGAATSAATAAPTLTGTATTGTPPASNPLPVTSLPGIPTTTPPTATSGAAVTLPLPLPLGSLPPLLPGLPGVQLGG
jgi:hypothetical protein